MTSRMALSPAIHPDETLDSLSLGQVKDVCEQIRVWRESGDNQRADRWQQRIGLLCSVDGCTRPTEHRQCKAHRAFFDEPLSPLPQLDRALRVVEALPTASDEEICELADAPITWVNKAREIWRAKHGGPHLNQTPVLRAIDVLVAKRSWPESHCAVLARVDDRTMNQAKEYIRRWGVM